jgi:DnaJ-class molecular chaperone
MNATIASQVLGVGPGRVDRDALIGAWRAFARTHHPDRCPGDPGAAWRFATGREAFETLLERVAETPAPSFSYGPAGVVKGAAAARALPYEMRPFSTRDWRA